MHQHRKIPKKWKHSRIVPILEPGKDPTEAKNYRPIALLSNIGKLLERNLKMNVPKCNCLMVKGKSGKLYKNARGYVPTVCIGGDVIANTRSMEYLGEKLTENMTFKEDVDKILQKGKTT